jgi:hypothetical protein
MSDENENKNGPKHGGNDKVEKGAKIDLNENKIPDFKFTPSPPPPPPTTNSGESKSSSNSESEK